MNKTATLVQRLPGGTTDELGNETDDEREIDVICEIQLVVAEEMPSAGEAAISTWTIFLPTGTEVRTGDALEGVIGPEGEDYGDFELVGDPVDMRNGSKAMWHVEGRAKQTRAPEVNVS